MIKISGVAEQIIFHNESNGYAVVDFDIDGEMETVVGCFDRLQEGDYLEMDVESIEHPIYGTQYKMLNYRFALPTTQEGLVRYLGSGLLPGIGEKTAQEIVKTFGDNTLQIFDEQPEALLQVRGIGKKTHEKMMAAYVEHKSVREMLIQLQEYGISTTNALKIHNVYKDRTVSILLEDPYQIVQTVRGIGFRTADQIASQLGIDKENPQRLYAGIAFVLSMCYTKGNTYMQESKLIENAATILEVPQEDIALQIQELVLTGEIIMDTVQDVKVYYPTELYVAEESVAVNLIRLMKSPIEDRFMDLDQSIRQYATLNDITLDETQREAIQEAVANSILVITGGPGTGKTTIIKGIVRLFEEMSFKIALAAPTGRAAKRMSETTERDAKTIHRLLDYHYSDDRIPYFQRDEDSPLDYDVIILDEVSMIDIQLMNGFLKALRQGTRLIMVGDSDQLPSVGPGNVLQDIIHSGVVKVIRLERIYRQSEKSMIAINAHDINEGIVPKIDNESDFVLIKRHEQDAALQDILSLVKWRLPNRFGYDPMEQIQIISPFKKGKLGVVALNKALQEVLNPPTADKKQKNFGEMIFREGDKVMQIRNNYQLKWVDAFEEGEGVYNGDIGEILNIDEAEKQIEILFTDDKRALYEFDQLDELTHAYAMTIHKSQGSEFPVVIMPLLSGSTDFLDRKLLYTAVTRAKKLLILIGQPNNFGRMVHATQAIQRHTNLSERMMKYHQL